MTPNQKAIISDAGELVRANRRLDYETEWAMHASLRRRFLEEDGETPAVTIAFEEVTPADYIALKARFTEAIDILDCLRDDNPCHFDHHGYCQEHAWLTEGRCPQARLKDLYDRMDQVWLCKAEGPGARRKP